MSYTIQCFGDLLCPNFKVDGVGEDGVHLSEMLNFIIRLRRLSAGEEFIEFCRRKNFKVYNMAVSFATASPNRVLRSVVVGHGRTCGRPSIS